MQKILKQSLVFVIWFFVYSILLSIAGPENFILFLVVYFAGLLLGYNFYPWSGIVNFIAGVIIVQTWHFAGMALARCEGFTIWTLVGKMVIGGIFGTETWPCVVALILSYPMVTPLTLGSLVRLIKDKVRGFIPFMK